MKLTYADRAARSCELLGANGPLAAWDRLTQEKLWLRRPGLLLVISGAELKAGIEGVRYIVRGHSACTGADLRASDG